LAPTIIDQLIEVVKLTHALAARNDKVKRLFITNQLAYISSLKKKERRPIGADSAYGIGVS
jgi:hypothetical protein